MADTFSPAAVFSFVATFLTVALGLWGFRHEYRGRNGKMKQAGWIASGLIVALGTLSLVSSFYDRRQADQKQREDAAQRAAQFVRQMQRLSDVTGSLERLQVGMSASLATGQSLNTKTDANLRISSRLGEQARTNTNDVLNFIFTEANRVSAERIALTVALLCARLPQKYVAYPKVESVTLRLKALGGSWIKAVSTQQTALASGTVFHGFLADLGSLEIAHAWSVAHVAVDLDGPLPGGIAQLDNSGDTTDDDRDAKMNPVTPSHCPLVAYLSLSGRTVGSIQTEFRRSDTLSGYHATVSQFPIDASRLPRRSNR